MDDKMREEWNKCWRKVLEDACLDHANYAAAKAGFEYAWRARAAQPVVDEGLIRELEALKIGDVKLPKGYNITHPNDAHDEAIDKAIALFRNRQPGKVSVDEISLKLRNDFYQHSQDKFIHKATIKAVLTAAGVDYED